jgi:hypothetical protein
MNDPLQNAIDAINGYQTDDLVSAKCRALMVGYDRMFANNPYLPIAVEHYSESAIINPETLASSRTFRAAGKLDVVAEYGSRRILIDHKTTSDDITDPSGTYWQQLQIEGQVNHYMLLEWHNGRKIDEAVWDVMRKPSISPKKITKAEQRAVVAHRRYFDCAMSMETLEAVQVEPRETLEMYEARLVHDCTVERPERYFQRRTIPRLDSEILEYAAELWEHGQEILHARNTNRHARNSGACMLYGTPCRFIGLCSGHDQPDSGSWKRKECVHGELNLTNDGRNLITNSRIRCFQTCRRKHFYEYELGIERIDEEKKEALYFGTLWHVALEAWWLSFMKGDE